MSPDSIGARLRAARDDQGWSRADLALELRAIAHEVPGKPLPHVASLVDMIKQWETDQHKPKTRNQALLARALGKDPARLFDRDSAVQRPVPPRPPAESNGAAPRDYAATVRDTNTHLIVLDSRYGGTSIADVAAQAFNAARLALASGRHDADERDLQAAAGETGEIAAWCLYDADRLAESRATTHEAMLISRLAGDRDMELFELTHLALLDVKQRHSREALRIAEHTIEDGALAPRVEALFNIRAARALAQGGERARSLGKLDQVASALLDSMHPRDPAWAWWLDASELAVQRGLVHAELGEHAKAMPYFDEAAHGRLRQDPYSPRAQAGPVTAHGQQWGRAAYNDLVHLLFALTNAGAWVEAEAIAATVADFTREVVSAQTEVMLHAAIRNILRAWRHQGAVSSTLGDLAEQIATTRGWAI